ncbi:MAG TPA: YceI family protein [Kofleriaceae bacterium]|nr:YceI family protein [Kofleriaceae bacterium]
MGSPFAPVVLPIAALTAALVRWWIQGSGNVYTAVAKRFYIPDPDLGWQISTRHPIWLGLDACAAIVAIGAAIAVAGWIIRRREARLGRRTTALRGAAWLAGALPLALPVLAFARGGGPPGGLDTLPAATIQGIESGIVGIIDAPAGRYQVVAHTGTSITARLSAGHETFDARFGAGIRGGIQGSWQGDPHDFTRPVTAEVSVDATSVDTGNELRSTHAREEYLLTKQFPRITVTLDRVIAASQDGPNAIRFRAHGTLGLIGGTHSIEVTGTMKKVDPAALARLQIADPGGPGGDVLLVKAEFPVVIKQTALAKDAGDFDGEQIPIQVSLVMRHTGG